MTSHRHIRPYRGLRALGGSCFQLQVSSRAKHRRKKAKNKDEAALHDRETDKLSGNKEMGVSSLDSSKPIPQATFDVYRPSKNSSTYRLSLPFDASDEDVEAFNAYKRSCQSAGWSLIPERALDSEKVACIITEEKEDMDDLDIAAAILDSTLRSAFQGVTGGSGW